MAFDIGGKIILMDEFSATFDSALAKADATESAFKDVGAAADSIGTADLSGSTAQLDAMRASSIELQETLSGWKVEVDTDAAELGLQSVQERIAELEGALTQARAKAKGGAVITPEGLNAYKQAESELATLKGGLAQMTGESGKADMSLKSLAIGIAALAAAGFAAQKIATMAYELTNLGAAAIDAQTAFQGLARVKGVDADQLLGGLEEAAKGAVGDAELMAAANKIMLDSGSELADKLPALFDAARASAQVTGKDTVAAFEGIVQAVDSADEAALRAQGLAVNLSAANQAWADANGRVVSSLTDQERAQIAASAALDAAGPLILELGTESATASEKMKSLPVAVDELKQSLGELMAQAGVVDFVANLATVFSGAADAMDVSQSVSEVRKQLELLGDDKALATFDAQIKAIQDRAGGPNMLNVFASEDDFASWSAAGDAAMKQVTSDTEEYIQALQRAGTHGSMYDDATGSASAAAAATSTYQAALDALNVSLAGTAALEKQFADAVVTGNASLSIMPEMPDISAAMDTSALRAWGDAWAAINPNLSEARASLENTAVSIQAHQQAVLSDALAITDMDARLQFLTTALLGSGASVDDLIGSLGSMPPELLAAIGPADELGASLARLKAATDQEFVIRVTMAGYASVANDIEGLAVRVAKLYGPEKARAFYDAAISENKAYWSAIDVQDSLGAKMAAGAITDALGGVVGEAEQSFGRVQAAGTAAFDGIAASAGELQGKIESALSQGLAVTAEDMARAMAGSYEDVPLEAAKRLDAVAARGFAELQAHPDWAAILEIPPEVLSGSEAGLKAWAAGTSSDVKNLLRPDLIDWTAFIGDFQQSLDDEAAKKLTIDIAVDKLTSAGLLTGSDEDRRKKVAEMLGIEAPELTIEALFKTSPTARTDMINEITGGTGVVAFDAVMNVVNKAAEDLAPPATPLAPTDPGYDRWQKATDEAMAAAPVDVAKMVDVEASSEALLASGARVAELLSRGVTDSIDMSGAVALTASSITLGADDFAKELSAAGGAMWGKVMVGVEEAIDNGSPAVMNRFAEKLAPGVAAILARDARRTGGP